MADNVKVVIRVRPLNEREARTATSNWSLQTNSIQQLENSRNVGTDYRFDRIFDPNETTNDLYEESISSIVEGAMQGFNGTIFAYGQTGSGKTFTMSGSALQPGITPQAMHHIYDMIESTPQREFLLRVSYMEIYQEKVSDMLSIDPTKNLKLQEDNEHQVSVVGLTEEVVASTEDVLKAIHSGERHRHVGVTTMNDQSSRSHAIFRMIIESRERSKVGESDNADRTVIVSHLNFVDLAGSERASENAGERLREGCSINRSLLMLSRVIYKLSESDSGNQHISFRDSKLTRILQNALGGNSKTAMICTITMASIDETHSTLRFASSAKSIKNKPTVNEVLSDKAVLRRYRSEIQRLQEMLKEYKNTGVDDLQKKYEESQLRIKELNEKICVSSVTGLGAFTKKKKLRRETWCPGPKLSSTPLTKLPGQFPALMEEPPSDTSVFPEGVVFTDESLSTSVFQQTNYSEPKPIANQLHLPGMDYVQSRRKRSILKPCLELLPNDIACQTESWLEDKPSSISYISSEVQTDAILPDLNDSEPNKKESVQRQSDQENVQRRSDHENVQRQSDQENVQRQSDQENVQRQSDQENVQRQSNQENVQRQSDQENVQRQSNQENVQRRSDLEDSIALCTDLFQCRENLQAKLETISQELSRKTAKVAELGETLFLAKIEYEKLDHEHQELQEFTFLEKELDVNSRSNKQTCLQDEVTNLRSKLEQFKKEKDELDLIFDLERNRHQQQNTEFKQQLQEAYNEISELRNKFDLPESNEMQTRVAMLEEEIHLHDEQIRDTISHYEALLKAANDKHSELDKIGDDLNVANERIQTLTAELNTQRQYCKEKDEELLSVRLEMKSMMESADDMKHVGKEDGVTMRKHRQEMTQTEEDGVAMRKCNHGKMQAEDGITMRKRSHEKTQAEEDGVTMRKRNHEKTQGEEDGVTMRKRNHEKTQGEEDGVTMRKRHHEKTQAEEVGVAMIKHNHEKMTAEGEHEMLASCDDEDYQDPFLELEDFSQNMFQFQNELVATIERNDKEETDKSYHQVDVGDNLVQQIQDERDLAVEKCVDLEESLKQLKEQFDLRREAEVDGSKEEVKKYVERIADLEQQLSLSSQITMKTPKRIREEDGVTMRKRHHEKTQPEEDGVTMRKRNNEETQAEEVGVAMIKHNHEKMTAEGEHEMLASCDDEDYQDPFLELEDFSQNMFQFQNELVATIERNDKEETDESYHQVDVGDNLVQQIQDERDLAVEKCVDLEESLKQLKEQFDLRRETEVDGSKEEVKKYVERIADLEQQLSLSSQITMKTPKRIKVVQFDEASIYRQQKESKDIRSELSEREDFALELDAANIKITQLTEELCLLKEKHDSVSLKNGTELGDAQRNIYQSANCDRRDTLFYNAGNSKDKSEICTQTENDFIISPPQSLCVNEFSIASKQIAKLESELCMVKQEFDIYKINIVHSEEKQASGLAVGEESSFVHTKNTQMVPTVVKVFNFEESDSQDLVSELNSANRKLNEMEIELNRLRQYVAKQPAVSDKTISNALSLEVELRQAGFNRGQDKSYSNTSDLNDFSGLFDVETNSYDDLNASVMTDFEKELNLGKLKVKQLEDKLRKVNEKYSNQNLELTEASEKITALQDIIESRNADGKIEACQKSMQLAFAQKDDDINILKAKRLQFEQRKEYENEFFNSIGNGGEDRISMLEAEVREYESKVSNLEKSFKIKMGIDKAVKSQRNESSSELQAECARLSAEKIDDIGEGLSCDASVKNDAHSDNLAIELEDANKKISLLEEKLENVRSEERDELMLKIKELNDVKENTESLKKTLESKNEMLEEKDTELADVEDVIMSLEAKANDSETQLKETRDNYEDKLSLANSKIMELKDELCEMKNELGRKINADSVLKMSEKEGDMPRKVSDELSEQQDEEICRDVLQKVSDELSEQQDEEICRDVPQKVPDELCEQQDEEICRDVPQKVPDELSEQQDEEICRDVPQNVPDELSEHQDEEICRDEPSVSASNKRLVQMENKLLMLKEDLKKMSEDKERLVAELFDVKDELSKNDLNNSNNIADMTAEMKANDSETQLKETRDNYEDKLSLANSKIMELKDELCEMKNELGRKINAGSVLKMSEKEGDMPRKVSDELSEQQDEEICRDVLQKVSDELSEQQDEEICRDVPQKVPDELCEQQDEEICRDVPQNVPDELSEHQDEEICRDEPSVSASNKRLVQMENKLLMLKEDLKKMSEDKERLVAELFDVKDELSKNDLNNSNNIADMTAEMKSPKTYADMKDAEVECNILILHEPDLSDAKEKIISLEEQLRELHLKLTDLYKDDVVTNETAEQVDEIRGNLEVEELTCRLLNADNKAEQLIRELEQLRTELNEKDEILGDCDNILDKIETDHKAQIDESNNKLVRLGDELCQVKNSLQQTCDTKEADVQQCQAAEISLKSQIEELKEKLKAAELEDIQQKYKFKTEDRKKSEKIEDMKSSLSGLLKQVEEDYIQYEENMAKIHELEEKLSAETSKSQALMDQPAQVEQVDEIRGNLEVEEMTSRLLNADNKAEQLTRELEQLRTELNEKDKILGDCDNILDKVEADHKAQIDESNNKLVRLGDELCQVKNSLQQTCDTKEADVQQCQAAEISLKSQIEKLKEKLKAAKLEDIQQKYKFKTEDRKKSEKIEDMKSSLSGLLKQVEEDYIQYEENMAKIHELEEKLSAETSKSQALMDQPAQVSSDEMYTLKEKVRDQKFSIFDLELKLRTDTRKLRETVSGHEQTIKYYEEKVSQLKNDIRKVQQEMADSTVEQVDEIRGNLEVEEMTSRLLNADNKAEQLTRELEQLRTELNEKDEILGDCDNILDKVEAGHKAQIDESNNKLVRLGDELCQVKNSLQQTCDTKEADVQQCQAAEISLKSQIEELKEKLKAAELEDIEQKNTFKREDRKKSEKIEDMKSSLSGLLKQVEEDYIQYEENMAKIHELEEKLSAETSKSQALMDQPAQVEQVDEIRGNLEVEELTSRLLNADNKAEQLTRKLEQLRTELNEKDEILGDCDNILDKVEADHKAQIDESNNKLVRLGDELCQVKNSLQQTCDTKEADVQQCQAAEISLKSQIEELKEKLKAAKLEDIQQKNKFKREDRKKTEKIEDMKSSSRGLLKQVEEDYIQYEENMAKIHELEEKLSAETSKSQALMDQPAQVEQVDEIRGNLEVEELTSRLLNADNKAEQLTRELEQLRTELNEKDEILGDCDNILDKVEADHKAQIDESNNKLVRLGDELCQVKNSLQQTCDTKEADVQQCQAAEISLKSQIEELKEKLKAAKLEDIQQKNKFKREDRKKTEKIEDMKSSSRGLLKQVEEDYIQYEENMAKIHELEEKLSAETSKSQALMDQPAQVEQVDEIRGNLEVEELTSRLLNADNKAEQLTRELEQLRTELNEKDEILGDCDNILDKVEADHKAQIDESNNKLVRLGDELCQVKNSLQQTCDTKEADVQQCQAAEISLKSQIEELKEKLKAAKLEDIQQEDYIQYEENMAKIHELEEKLSAETSKSQALMDQPAQVEQVDEIRGNLEVEEMTSRLLNADNKAEQLTRELEQLRTELNEKDEILGDCDNILDKVEADHKAQIDECNNKLVRLGDELCQVKNSLQQTCDTKEADVQQCQAAEISLKSQIEELKEKLKAAKLKDIQQKNKFEREDRKKTEKIEYMKSSSRGLLKQVEEDYIQYEENMAKIHELEETLSAETSKSQALMDQPAQVSSDEMYTLKEKVRDQKFSIFDLELKLRTDTRKLRETVSGHEQTIKYYEEKVSQLKNDIRKVQQEMADSTVCLPKSKPDSQTGAERAPSTMSIGISSRSGVHDAYAVYMLEAEVAQLQKRLKNADDKYAKFKKFVVEKAQQNKENQEMSQMSSVKKSLIQPRI